MTVIGYSTLEVIPSVKGMRQALDKQTSGDLTSAGKSGGKKYGDAAGSEAARGFKSRMSAGMKGFALPIAGILAGAGVGAFFKGAFEEAKEAGKVSRVTAKLIESTGQAANLTASQVGELSEQMMDYAAIDDELIQSGANVMLTFKNVKNAAGEGNQIFDRSIKAGLDLSAVLGTDLAGSALQLGKALNDPIKGVTSLGRAGVQFTAQQKEQIKALVESGRLLDAQKIILGEIEGQVGGAAGAAADGTDRLAVAMGNLKESFGQEIMPAVEVFSNWATDDGIPALTATGGAAKDAAQAFGSLPAPVQAAAGAFAALKIASSFGLTDALAAGAARTGTAMESLRIRAVAVGTGYGQARQAAIVLTGANAGVTMGAGRLTAALAGIRAGAIGAGAAMRGFGASAIAALGGPWGIALIAATAALTYFMSQQDEAREKIDGLTETLDKQTGAITGNTRARIAQALEDRGLLKTAEQLGFSLSTVTDAALGNASALDEVRVAAAAAAGETERLAANPALPGGSAAGERSRALSALAYELGLVAAETGGAVEAGRRLAAANKEGAGATSNATGALTDYRTEIAKVRTELQKLIDKEQKRTLLAIQNQRDELALVTTMQATREEARKGAHTLDINTKAGQENKAALLDLADQWANSTPQAQKAIGGYEEMRQQFIKVATEMGATKKQAKDLADELLKVPKTAPLRFQSEGFKERMAEIRALRREAAHAFTFSVAYVNSKLPGGKTLASYASGGRIGGIGTGTSDSNLIFASRGEFMQRKAAVDYYGLEFMRRLNALQIPKFAQGGPITVAAPQAMASSAPLFDMRGTVIQTPDPKAFMDFMQRRSQSAGSDNVRMR